MNEPIPPLASDESLLAHWAWVRRLARELIADPEQRDDVVQQAWLVTLQKRPRGTDLRRWFGHVLRTLSRHRHRSEARRAAHESQATLIDGVPTPAELVEQADQWHGLLAAVARLEEPYRSTILLRFYRELTPRDIAKQLGIPSATVRSRVKRGLQQLRENLDREHGGERRTWCALLAPLTAVPPPTGAWIATATGGLLLGTKIKLAATGVIVAATAFTWNTWQREPDTMPKVASKATKETPSVDSPSFPSDSASVQRVPQSAARLEVYGAVVTPDGQPIPKARFEVVKKGQGSEDDQLLADGICDDGGQFRLEVSAEEPSLLFVVARAEGYWAELADVAPDSPTQLTLNWKATVIGQVRDEVTQEPVADAKVRVNNGSAVTDANGQFQIHEMIAGDTAWFAATKHGFLDRSGNLLIEAGPETRYDILLEPGRELFVQAVDRESQEPLPGISILSFVGEEPLGTTDEQGRFPLYVKNGSGVNIRAVSDGYAPTYWHYDVRDAEAPPSPKLPLLRWASIDGVVLAEDGSPLTSASVRLRPSARPDGRIELTEEEQERFALPGYAYSNPAALSCTTDANGAFQIAVVPAPTPYSIEAHHPDYAPTRIDHLALETSGDRQTVTLQLWRGANIHGRALRNGKPWPGTVVCEAEHGWEVGRAEVDSHGRYELSNIPPQTVSVQLRGFTEGKSLPPATLILESGDSQQHDFLWEEALTAIRGTVRNHDGEPVSGIEVSSQRFAENGEYRSTSALSDSEGHYELAVTPGHEYTVSVFQDPVLLQEHRIRAGSQGVDFTLPRLVPFQFQLMDAASGRPVGGGSLRVYWRQEGVGNFRTSMATVSADGLLDFSLPLGPTEVVFGFGGGYPRTDLGSVMVGERQAEPMEVPLVRGVEVILRFRPGVEDVVSRLAGHVLFALHDEELDWVRGPYENQGPHSNYNINETVLWLRDPAIGDSLLHVDEQGNGRLSGLRPGHYTLRSFPDQFEFEPKSFWLDAASETVSVDVEWWPR